jgi:hypothetical protein
MSMMFPAAVRRPCRTQAGRAPLPSHARQLGDVGAASADPSDRLLAINIPYIGLSKPHYQCILFVPGS